MKKLLALAFAMLMMAACTKTPTTTDSTQTGDTAERKEFTTVYAAELSHINYLKSSLSSNTQFTYNIVDGLIDFDKYGVTVPCLATEWKASDDGLTYTFQLREGVNWYTTTGEVYAEVVAQDFVDAAKWILTKSNASTTSNIFYSVIKNAEDYFNEKITDISQVGIRAVDKYTVEYTLAQPTPYFVKMLSYSSFLPANGKFLEECGEMFGSSAETLLYNGAYILTSFEPENQRVLTFNENYWDKENIHISKITYNYNKEAKTLAPELFLRGEISEADIPQQILDEWMNDPVKKEMIQRKPTTASTNYLGFNFEPLYEEEYDPANWTTAVNNENFRKSIYYGFDRVSAILTSEPYQPENKLINTITTKNFANVAGTDYTQLAPLKAISDTNQFNAELAKEYKTKAMAELAGKATFPVKVVMPYNTSLLDLTNRVQVVEQQLEKLLGQEYIDIILVPYPPTGYLKEARSSGKFSIMEMGWGPDYADPAGYTEVMASDTSMGPKYSRPYLATEYLNADGTSIYDGMVQAARKETQDIAKRYELFAEAEAFLIEKALVIPFYVSGGDYRVTTLDPFSGPTTQFGRSLDKYKGKIVLDKPITPEEFEVALEKYNTERAEALKSVT